MKLLVVPTIEAPLAFLEEVVEAPPGDSARLLKCRFAWLQKFSMPPVWRLRFFTATNCLTVIHTPVVERRNPGHAAIGKAVRIDDAVRHHPGLQDRHQHLCLGARNWESVNASAALQQTEDGHLPGGAPSPLSLAFAAEVVFVHFHFPVQGSGLLHLSSDNDPQSEVEAIHRVAVHPDQLRCCSCGGSCNEVFEQA